MHTLKITLFILFFSILKTELNAQPSQFNYQGVARNASGAPIANQAIKTRLKIHDLAANGNVIYSETRTANTNSFGLFTVAIGSSGATDVTGNLTNIPWGDGIKFLHVEMDPLGGINFVDMGTTQLLSVPYALQANHLTLPSAQTAITNTSAFLIENYGTGHSILGRKGGSGLAVPSPAAVVGDASSNNTGVTGLSQSGLGLYGESVNGTAIYGLSHSDETAVYGKTDNLYGSGVTGVASNGGVGGSFTSTNGTALKTIGKIQMFSTGETAGKVLMTNATGNAQWEGGSAFSAYNTPGTAPLQVPTATETTIPFNNAEYNLGNDFFLSSSFINPSTFVAPVDGIYHFDAIIQWEGFSNGSGSTVLHLKKNGSTSYSVKQVAGVVSLSMQLSIDIRLTGGAKITLSVVHASGTTQELSLANSLTRFTGRFVSRL